jgi:hypothetical protein
MKYRRKLAPYTDPDQKTRDQELMKTLIKVREDVLAEWVDLMPTTDAVRKKVVAVPDEK